MFYFNSFFKIICSCYKRRMNKKYFIPSVLSLSLLLSSVFSACFNRNSYPMDNSFENIKKEFINELWRLNPGWALQAGNHNYDDVLEIPSLETMTQKIKIYSEFADSLKDYDWKKLNPDNQTDLRMIENYIDYYKWSVETYKSWQWNPAEYNVGKEFDLVLSNRSEPLEKRLSTVTERLKYVPAYFITAKGNIRNPTAEHTELAIVQNSGSLKIFMQSIPDSGNISPLTTEQKQLLNDRLANAVTAIKDYISFLTDWQKKQQKDSSLVRSFRIGKSLYDKKFFFEIQSKYTPEQIYEKAVQHKSELHKQMLHITTQLWKKYFGNQPMPGGLTAIQQMIDTLSADHCTTDSLYIAIKNQIPQLELFVKQKNLLYLDPTKPLAIREMPDYMACSGVDVSIYSPGPYDIKENTYYSITPIAKYDDARAVNFLHEYNNYTLQMLNMQEAIPGHYTQSVYSNMSRDTLKGILKNITMVNGWAAYGTHLMLEQGYGEDSPELWLMYCKWNLNYTLNSIIDYRIHCLNMSKQDAINLLVTEGFQSETEAEKNWLRAVLSPVELSSYFAGFIEIDDFRNEYRQKAGGLYNLKDFHEKFLSYGSAPVKYIRELMLKELQ